MTGILLYNRQQKYPPDVTSTGVAAAAETGVSSVAAMVTIGNPNINFFVKNLNFYHSCDLELLVYINVCQSLDPSQNGKDVLGKQHL